MTHQFTNHIDHTVSGDVDIILNNSVALIRLHKQNNMCSNNGAKMNAT